MTRAPDAAQRAVLHGVVRCRAGAQLGTKKVSGVPALRSGMKNAAPRPGHEESIQHSPDAAQHEVMRCRAGAYEASMGPGSAKQCYAPHRVRDTNACRRATAMIADEDW